MSSWAVAEAKAKFSELIETARAQGAQEITRNGKLVGVLVSPEEWKKAKHTPAQNARTMSDFFKNSPLAGAGLDLRRARTQGRGAGLGSDLPGPGGGAQIPNCLASPPCGARRTAERAAPAPPRASPSARWGT